MLAAMSWRLGLAGLLGALIALYAIVAPSLLHHHWDSLEYAFACEAQLSKRVWGNHPLGHVIQCGAFRAAVSLGYGGRALHFMSAFNAVVGAITVAALIGLLKSIDIPPRRALGWALVVAGMYGFWLYAATADVYAFSLLAQLGGWWTLLRAAEAPGLGRAAVAGLAAGLAVVAHQFNGPLLVGACLGLAPFARGARRPAIAHLATLALVATTVVVAGYYGIGVWSTGTTSREALEHWLIGYGADETYGRSFNLAGLAKAAGTSSQTLLKAPFSAELIAVWAGALALILAPVALGLALAPLSRGRLRPALASAVVQLAIGAPLIVWWAPYHIGKWWLLMLPALVVVQAAGVETLGRLLRADPSRRATRWLDAAVGAIACAALLFTGFVTMRGMNRVDEAFERTLDLWAAHTQRDDVIIQGDVTAHLLFWTGRPHALFLYRTVQAGGKAEPFSALSRVIAAAHEKGHAVYFVPGTVEALNAADLALVGATREELMAFLDRYPRTGPIFHVQPRAGLPEKPVYRLHPVKRPQSAIR